MEQLIVRNGLYGSAHRMPQVEHLSQAAFLFILHYHLVFHPAVMLAYILAHLTVTVKDLFDVLFKILKKLYIPKAAVLYGFRKAAGYLLTRQGLPGGNVDVDLFWLVEHSYEICGKRGIHRCFSPHRSVRSGKQGRCIIHKGHSSAKSACGKACKVCHHASPKGYHGAVTAKPLFQHGIFKKLFHLPCFGLFTVWDNKHIRIKACLPETFKHLCGIQLFHPVVGYNSKPFSAAGKPLAQIPGKGAIKLVTYLDVI